MPKGRGSQRWRRAVAFTEPPRSWIDQEIEKCTFVDERLGKRFRTLLEQLSDGTGESIPMACQDWANTKAAYRFLSNERVNERDILAGHFQSTRERFSASDEFALVLHDTTQFSYARDDGRAIGKLGKSHIGTVSRPQYHTVCGILMHSSLAVTPEGLPLGLSAAKFWTRDEFKGTNALKKHINPTRVPIGEKESICWLQNLRESTELLGAPDRCIHIGDRGSDIYELFCAASQAGTHFVFRTCVDRCAGDGDHTVQDEMQEVDCKGLHHIEVRDKKGNSREAVLELRYRRIRVLPSKAKEKLYPSLILTVIHANERDAPKGCEAIEWKLITDMPVRSRAEAIEKIDWYALRWKIEVFHKILKSGCRAEASKLRTAERLVNLIALFCIMGWRIFWMTMLNRSSTDAPPEYAFTPLEIRLLDQLVRDKDEPRSSHKRLSDYLTKVAQLGGYLARGSDPPPGNTVMWRGLSRLTDIEIGFLLGSKNCG
jgi:Transposase DNA-binding/Transposase DDE domain